LETAHMGNPGAKESCALLGMHRQKANCRVV
jgi:hypothetical protein